MKSRIATVVFAANILGIPAAIALDPSLPTYHAVMASISTFTSEYRSMNPLAHSAISSLNVSDPTDLI